MAADRKALLDALLGEPELNSELLLDLSLSLVEAALYEDEAILLEDRSIERPAPSPVAASAAN
jgi:hypothetical protein